MARVNQAEDARRILNDFLPQAMALLSSYVTDHGRHCAMCDALNDLKAEYCNEIRNKH